jgi:hypothetical protein
VLKGKEVKLKANPERSKMLAEIGAFDSSELKKPAVKKSRAAGGQAADGSESTILSSVGSLATKIALARKERAQQDIRSKRSKPQQSGRLDKMLSDLKDLDVNDLMKI